MKSVVLKSIFVCLAAASMAVPVREIHAAEPSVESGERTATAPAAVVPEPVFVFDEVLEGEIVTHVFAVANEGGLPLEILDVRTSCGCTTVQRPDRIPAGGRGEIVVRADTQGYGRHPFRKTVAVKTNDPDHPALELRIEGPVAEFARVEPRAMGLRGPAGEAIRAEAIITGNPAHPFRILEIVPGGELPGKIDVVLEERRDGYRLVVRNRLETPGTYRGRIVLKTDNPLRPELSVYVQANILDAKG